MRHTCVGRCWQSYRWWCEDSEDEWLEARDWSTIVSVVAELLGMLEASPTADAAEPPWMDAVELQRCVTAGTLWCWPSTAAESRGWVELYTRCTADEFTWAAAAVQNCTHRYHHRHIFNFCFVGFLYDIIWRSILACARKLTKARLVYCMQPENKEEWAKETKKTNTGYAQKKQ